MIQGGLRRGTEVALHQPHSGCWVLVMPALHTPPPTQVPVGFLNKSGDHTLETELVHLSHGAGVQFLLVPSRDPHYPQGLLLDKQRLLSLEARGCGEHSH